MVIFLAAFLFGSGFLGAAFVLGVSVEINFFGEAYQRLREADRSEGAILGTG